MFFDKQEIFKKALKLYSSGKIFIDFIENLKSEKNVYDFYEKDGVLIVRYF